MVKKLTFTLMCLATGVGMAVAQKTNVSGVVVSADNGEPVIGASVIVKGTTIGTVTDFDGKFNLEVPDGQKTLQISYVGMVQQEVAVRPNVSVRLISDTQNLDEVVVTAQGLTRKEKSLGYSTQQVKADELVQVRTTDLNNALVGKVSGVQFVGSSGATFDEGTIVLRGATSISSDRSDSAPIYVIDGVIADDANGVNMDDVASVNVLKGPAATALYGSRGGNGAIIITTKGGMDGLERMEINVSHTLTVDVPKIYFDLQDKYGGGYMGADAEMNTFHYDPSVHPEYLQALDGVQYYDYNNDASWGPVFDGRKYAPWYAWDPTDPRFGQTAKWENGLDLYDLYKNGISNTTNVAFSRSGKNHSSRISFSNVSRQGISPNSDASRRYLSARTSFKPIDRLTVSVDYKYTYRHNHNAAYEGYSTFNPLRTYTQWGHTNVDLNDLKENYIRPDGTFRTWNISSITNSTGAFHPNPYAVYEQINRDDIYQYNIFSGDAELEIWNNIKAGIRVNGNIRQFKSEREYPMNITDVTSGYEQTQYMESDIQTQGRITWGDRFVNDRLTVDAAIFFEDRQYSKDQVEAFTRDGLNMNYFYSTAGSAGLAGGNTVKTEMHERSVYGTVTAGWDDTYFIDGSLRNDWSSTLNPNNNSYLYGGLSVAAIASNWFKDAHWLNFWKLRASFAQVGSTLDAYNIYSVYKMRDSSDDIIKYGQLTNLWIDATLKNENIKPTISTSYEVGTEWRMFDNRFWGDFNFYNRDSKNQIINLNTTPASGYTKRIVNAGLIRNRGVELSLGGDIVRTKDWTWTLNANISRNRNTLEELTDGLTDYRLASYGFGTYTYLYAEVGEPIGVIRGTVYNRDPEGNIILTQRGDGSLVPSVNTSAQENLGNVQPDVTGGFSTSLRFKDFTLGMAFDFQIGGALASASNMFGYGSGLLAETAGYNDKGNPVRSSVESGGGVRVDGVVDNGDGTYTPKTVYMDANTYYQSYYQNAWENFVYKASYLKMRELSVRYNVPTAWLAKHNWGVKAASLSFVASNPWLIYSAVPNLDPSEIGGVSYSYLEGGQAPSTKSFGFTVNLTF